MHNEKWNVDVLDEGFGARLIIKLLVVFVTKDSHPGQIVELQLAILPELLECRLWEFDLAVFEDVALRNLKLAEG